ncbi:yfiH Multicopper polyphenol oxidase (laccase) [Acidimicrobiia bacterium]
MRFFDRALVDGRSIRVRSTEETDGDFARGDADHELDARRRSVVDRPWVWLTQVHGDGCVDVDAVGLEDACGELADSSVTRRTDLALSIQTADCVPIVLWSLDGVIAAVHAGWQGLEAGVIESAARSMRTHSSAPLHAFIGPSIGPECYEFGAEDLDRLEARFGPVIRAKTSDGRPALDVRAGVISELLRNGVVVDVDDDVCTACAGGFFSHRARADTARHATVIWIEES